MLERKLRKRFGRTKGIAKFPLRNFGVHSRRPVGSCLWSRLWFAGRNGGSNRGRDGSVRSILGRVDIYSSGMIS
jgi:hypothetical protein